MLIESVIMNTEDKTGMVHSIHELDLTGIANENIGKWEQSTNQSLMTQQRRLVVEPDKGFAWCVLFSAFLANMIAVGVQISMLHAKILMKMQIYILY